jgi:hypothetical protein
VERQHGVLLVQFQNPAGTGIISPKTQHGYHVPYRTAFVCLYETRDIEIS